MQVSHASDLDTHAIMGGGQKKAFGINLTSDFITVLSSTLYSDNFLATVRETICNAWDAHKIVGLTARPIEIFLNQSSLKIKDFGPGIPHDKMQEIYATYGGSTKQKDENQTGGFGLGAKAPFSYNDFFNVENCHDGIMGIYAISRGSSDTDGMPDFTEIIKVPTVDTGIMVEIPIRDPSDQSRFEQVIRGVVELGGINATLNGEQLKTIPMDQAKEGFLITTRVPYINNGLLYVQYGNVIYPIKEHRAYADLYRAANEIMERARYQWKKGYQYDRKGSKFICIFEGKPNSLSVTPSREDLHSSDRTVATISMMLSEFIGKFQAFSGSDKILAKEREILGSYVEQGKEICDLFADDNLIKAHASLMDEKYVKEDGDFFSAEEYEILLYTLGKAYEPRTLSEARKQRMAIAIQEAGERKFLFQRMSKILDNNPKLWIKESWRYADEYVRNELVYDLPQKAAKHGLNPANLIYWNRHANPGRQMFAGTPLLKKQTSLGYLIEQTRRVVIVFQFKSQIQSYDYKANKPNNWDKIHSDRAILYMVTPGKKFASYEDTLKFFERMRYTVIDLVKFAKDNAPAPMPKVAKPKVVKPPVWKKPKDSFIGLESFIDKGSYNNFNYRRHLDVDPQKLKYITNPVAVCVPRNIAKRHYDKGFFHFRDYKAELIVKHFGAQIAVVKSQTEKDALIKTGAKDGETYIIEQLRDAINASPNIETTLRNERAFGSTHGFHDGYYEILRTKTKCGAHLPPLPFMTEEEQELLAILSHFESYSYSIVNPASREIIKDLVKQRKLWKEDNPLANLKKLFSKDFEHQIQRINFAALLQDVENKNTAPEKRAYAETLLSMAFFS